jgi:hypothetical protein
VNCVCDHGGTCDYFRCLDSGRIAGRAVKAAGHIVDQLPDRFAQMAQRDQPGAEQQLGELITDLG